MRQKYRKKEDQKTRPWLACSLDFAQRKGLEPKVKKVSKILQIGLRGKQTSLTQTEHRWGSGGRLLGNFLQFF